MALSKCAALKRDLLSVSAIFEMELQTESEVTQKQRQYRLLDRNRGQVAGALAAKIAKQQKVMKIMKEEQRNLLTDLVVSTCSTRKKADKLMFNNLSDLLQTYGSYEEKIALKKSQLEDLDMEIDNVKKKLVEARKQQITDAEWTKYIEEGNQTIAALENKLDTCTKKFCSVLTNNQAMRIEIERLLNERRKFNKQWHNIVGNLEKGKSFMMDIVEQSTIAYDQRDEWCTKLQALRTRAKGDFVLHTEDMISLQRQIDHDNKLLRFMSIKTQKRVMHDLTMKEKQKKALHLEKMRETLDNYKKILEQVSDFMGSDGSNVNDIVYKYVQKDELLFSKFLYNCELATETEELSTRLYQLKKNINKQRWLKVIRQQRQDTVIALLKEGLDESSKEKEKAQRKANNTLGELEKLYVVIKKLFNICKTSSSPILQLLGNNTQINHYNVEIHLNLLEARVLQLLLICYYKQQEQSSVKGKKSAIEPPNIINDSKIPGQIYEIDEIVTSQPCPLCIDQEMVSDVIDILQFAQMRDEVIKKLAERLQFPDALERIHNVSACHLPKSRQIIQRRYQ